MRIAIVLPGGVDRSARYRVIPVLLNLIERLARRHQVTVVAIEHYPDWCEYSLLGARVINLGRVCGLGRASRWSVRLKRLLSALRSGGAAFDVIHAFWAKGPGSLAVAAGRVLHVPTVVSIGGGELVWLPDISYGGQGNWINRIETTLALRVASGVSGGSYYSLKPCMDRRTDAVWLPLGVDTGAITGLPDRSPGPPWRLLQVASINRVKDQTTLLQAMQIVLRHNQDIHLDCIGTDTLANRLQQMAADMGLSGHVSFSEFKPLDDVIPFYHQTHLYVQSSLHESMGAAVLEAAAAGVPTVGTAVGLVAEMAPNAALSVPVRDPGALAEGILTLLADRQRRTQLGRAAQEFARTYDADWTAMQFEALYSRLARV